ncbi:MAG TPA: sensor histidine kinase [Microthrixaceae bacterium]|nr:sensor histidine kinase [Microthrixaceae bacterium]
MALSEALAAEVDLPPPDRAHLVRLVASWSVLADFCFSDLVLYVPTRAAGDDRAEEFTVVAHIRPSTSQTIYHSELVGERRTATQRPIVARAAETGDVALDEIDSTWLGHRIQVMAIPVRREGRIIAVLARESPSSIRRVPGELEQIYRRVFDRFAEMIASGSFPYPREPREVLVAPPRVGDGVVVVDGDATVRYASPNAISALIRAGHDGNLAGRSIDEIGLDAVAVADALASGEPAVGELEHGETSIAVRALPLWDRDEVSGVVVLLRDVSDLRIRDRLLVSKDATIREIHHRVKNNLQTISSLLRLQGRRLTEPSAKAVIEESVRRIRSIAIVHEILSRDTGDDVALTEVIRPLVRMVEEGLVSPDQPVRFEIRGNPGVVSSPTATSLAVVLTELLQNVVEHAYPPDLPLADQPAKVRLDLRQENGRLLATVRDDGVGVPDGFDLDTLTSLGLSIVRNLVETELGGSISVGPGDGPPGRCGTVVRLEIPLEGSTF